MTETMVWITGASGGLGAALAATVPWEDAAVVDVSRSGGTPGTEHVAADLADPAAWHAVAAHLRARLGEFRGDRAVFVHNAGTLVPLGPADQVDHAELARNVLLNSASGQVLGSAFLSSVAASGFDGEAHVAWLSSGAAQRASAGWATYAAGKAAAEQWVRCVGLEQAERPRPVKVVAVTPGVAATAMQEQIRATDAAAFPAVERFRRLHREGQLRDPADAARDLWAVVTDPDVPTGAVVDVRSRG